MLPVPIARMDRRNALRVIGAAGAGLVFAACSKDDGGGAAATTTTGETSATTATTPATTVGGSTTQSPPETGGPYPADGTQGASKPNVLDDDGIVRRDLTRSFGDYSGSTDGTPLTTKLTVVKAGTGVAYAGAAVYLWHCDAKGLYSLYSQGAADQNFCRGVQAADDNGELTFDTVFPGAYQGRYPHFHYEVFSSLDDAKSAGNRLLTSQIALPEDA
ncbi:MAG: hypothetical protein QOI61_42, partial [Actinomycetota bacterium]